MECKLCGETDSNEFYVSNNTKCKACIRKAVIKNRLENASYYHNYDRNRPNAKERNEKFKKAEEIRRKDPLFREKRNALSRQWSAKNTIKRAAHIICGNAIRDGRLTKMPCEVCGELIVDAHHDDYEKPMVVRWLCHLHHSEHHKIEREKVRQV